MCRDCYELDLPEASWAESYRENKEFIDFAVLVMSVPVAIGMVSAAVFYFTRKVSL